MSDDSEDILELQVIVDQLQGRVAYLEEVARVSAATDELIVGILNNHSISHDATIVNFKRIGMGMMKMIEVMEARGGKILKMSEVLKEGLTAAPITGEALRDLYEELDKR